MRTNLPDGASYLPTKLTTTSQVSRTLEPQNGVLDSRRDSVIRLCVSIPLKLQTQFWSCHDPSHRERCVDPNISILMPHRVKIYGYMGWIMGPPQSLDGMPTLFRIASTRQLNKSLAVVLQHVLLNSSDLIQRIGFKPT